MSLDYDAAVRHIRGLGFYVVEHPVVLHHMRKDFSHLEVLRSSFYILPVGPDFLHVAIVEMEYGLGITDNNGVVKHATIVKYACAGDDLLYGLRTKYPCGGSPNNTDDLRLITDLSKMPSLREHLFYIRARFRHTRIKAKTRALFIMVQDLWRSFWRF